MLNKKQARQLRALIEDYAEAMAEAAHAGAKSVEDAQALRDDVKLAKANLDKFINGAQAPN